VDGAKGPVGEKAQQDPPQLEASQYEIPSTALTSFSIRDGQGPIIIREEEDVDKAGADEVVQLAYGKEDGKRVLAYELRSQEKCVLSLVAVQGGCVVGHLSFSPMLYADGTPTEKAVGQAPVSVMPRKQRCGIGSRLVAEGIRQLQRRGYELVATLGHPGYYSRKFGFVRADRHGIQNEFGAGAEFMVLELLPGSLKNYGGLLRYRPEFSEFTSSDDS